MAFMSFGNWNLKHGIVMSAALAVSLVISVVATAQSDEMEFVNQKPVDPDRYEDIKGSPFYFEDWVTGDIMRNDAFIFENVQINYNGYTKTFEVLTGDRMIELVGRQYLRIDVDLEDNPGLEEVIVSDDFAFQRNLHPKFADRFVIILLNYKGYMLIKDFEVDIAKHTVQNVGKPVDFKDFNIKNIYYIKSPDGLEQIKLRRKGIEDYFDDPRMDDFIKEKGLKFNSESDLISAFKYYAELVGG